MNYIICNGQSYIVTGLSAAYRGTDRNRPIYCDALPEHHEMNELFNWYLEETEQSGFVHDLAKARRYVELCNKYFQKKHFELIQVTVNQPPPGDSRLLGFDISLAGNGDSLIFLALLPAAASRTPEEPTTDEPIAVLTHLIRCHYIPKLNEFGLFDTFEDAFRCRKAMIALQSFQPNLYEGGDLTEFRVVGVSLLR